MCKSHTVGPWDSGKWDSWVSGRVKGRMVPPGQGGSEPGCFSRDYLLAPKQPLLLPLASFDFCTLVRVRMVGNLGQPVMVEGSLKDRWSKCLS